MLDTYVNVPVELSCGTTIQTLISFLLFATIVRFPCLAKSPASVLHHKTNLFFIIHYNSSLDRSHPWPSRPPLQCFSNHLSDFSIIRSSYHRPPAWLARPCPWLRSLHHTSGTCMLTRCITYKLPLFYTCTGPLLDWVIHVLGLGAYTALNALSGPLRSGPLRAMVVALAASNSAQGVPSSGPSFNAAGPSGGAGADYNRRALTPRQLYTLNRVLEALEYGSGQDYRLWGPAEEYRRLSMAVGCKLWGPACGGDAESLVIQTELK